MPSRYGRSIGTGLCAATALASVATAFSPPSLPLSARFRPTANTALSAERTATFGMGCFWAPAESMRKVPGVTNAVAGYTGYPDYAGSGTPSYESVCYSRNWVEGVRVTYDDDVISYPQLLDAFFEAQEPKVGSRQYASVIFPSTEGQRSEAEQWLRDGVEASRTREKDGVPVQMTQIEPESAFYMAEGYHQNYWEKWRIRYGIGAVLLVVSSGGISSFIPDPSMAHQLETIANGVVTAGCAGAILERFLDSKVVKL